MLTTILQFFAPYVVPIIIILAIVLVLPLLVGYVVQMERKVMADMQARLGPMRVGPHGLLQPIADALKLLLKEDIIPENADKFLFWIAPLISCGAGMLAFSGLTFAPGKYELFGNTTTIAISDMNIGLLFIVAVSSLGIYGIVLGGWSSNSHYSLLGALRSAAQMVSYETAAGLSLVAGLLLAGSLSTKAIVDSQALNGVWFIFLAPVAFFIYLVAGIAETNRAPFDLPEAESELVAGYMTEYSGFRWSVYFLAEYCNMIVVSSIATTLFLGGWLRPFANTAAFNFLDFFPALFFFGIGGYCLWRVPKLPERIHSIVMVAFAGLFLAIGATLALPVTVLPAWKPVMHGVFWFLFKVVSYLYCFMWFRFTFPRYRFDQLMRLGWNFMIPVSLVNVMALGVALILSRPVDQGGLGWHLRYSIPLTTLVTLIVAGWLRTTGVGKDKVMVGEA